MTSVSSDRRFGVNSGKAVKVPCKAATTANITLSGEQTIDGVSCVTDDRVLVKNQTTASQNGIYVVDTGAWSRALDFDDNNDICEGTMVEVNRGSANALTFWQLNTQSPTIGSSLTFVNYTIPNVVSLIAGITTLRATTPVNGMRVYLEYHTTSGDGGHGYFRGITGASPGTYTHNNGTIVVPSGGDGSAAWLREYTGPIHAVWFGVTADGTTNDTTAMQACIDYAIVKAAIDTKVSVKLPSGAIKLGSGLTVNCPSYSFSMIGEGQWETTFKITSDIGNVFVVTGCPGGRFQDFGITASLELTTGSFLKLVNLYRFELTNMYLAEGYETIRMENCTGVYMTNVKVVGAYYFTDVTYKANSAMLHFAASGAGNNGIFLNNCTFDPSSLTPATGSKYQYAVWVESIDGLWVNNCHIAGGYLSHLKINPVVGSPCSGMKFSNTWIDYWGQRCLNIGNNVAADTKNVQDVTFSSCTFQGATTQLALIYGAGIIGVAFVGCTFEYSTGDAIHLYGGIDILFSGCNFIGNNTSLHQSTLVVAGGTESQDLVFTGNNFRGGTNTDYHLNLGASTGPIVATGNNFNAHQVSAIYNAGVTALHAVGNYGHSQSGSGTINSGATSATITHSLGWAPSANQISIVGKELATNDIGYWYVDTITTTQFTVHVKADPGASNFDFGWSIN